MSTVEALVFTEYEWGRVTHRDPPTELTGKIDHYRGFLEQE